MYAIEQTGSYDGKRISSDQIMDMLNRKLEARRLSVTLLKVLDQRVASKAVPEEVRPLP